jgi:hypothetical protein
LSPREKRFKCEKEFNSNLFNLLQIGLWNFGPSILSPLTFNIWPCHPNSPKEFMDVGVYGNGLRFETNKHIKRWKMLNKQKVLDLFFKKYWWCLNTFWSCPHRPKICITRHKIGSTNICLNVLEHILHKKMGTYEKKNKYFCIAYNKDPLFI